MRVATLRRRRGRFYRALRRRLRRGREAGDSDLRRAAELLALAVGARFADRRWVGDLDALAAVAEAYRRAREGG